MSTPPCGRCATYRHLLELAEQALSRMSLDLWRPFQVIDGKPAQLVRAVDVNYQAKEVAGLIRERLSM